VDPGGAPGNSWHRQSLDAPQQHAEPNIRLRRGGAHKEGPEMEIAAIQLFAAVALWMLNALIRN
jgi:hypothetical protein